MVKQGTSPDTVDTYLAVIIFFAASLVLGDYGIRVYVSVLHSDVPSRIIAAFTEPITTKLVPGLAVVYIHHRYDVPFIHLQSHPYWFALIGGLSLGVSERIMYVVVRDAPITPEFLLAPWMHAVNAVLIAGLIFHSADRAEGRRFFGKLLMGTMLAMVIHLFWNTWGVVLIHQTFT